MKIPSRLQRKGQLGQAIPAVVTLVSLAVIVGVGLTVLQEVQETQFAGIDAAGNQTTTVASNATADGIAGLATFSSFQTTIAVIVVAVIVIGLLLGGLAVQAARR